MLYNYQYDQLNRLVKMDAWSSSDSLWSNIGTTPLSDFQESVAYDPNGNILKYKRNGNSTFAGQPLGMDSLSYAYINGTNKLDHINDSVPSGNYPNDLDNQSSDNYSYDAIGELTGDNASGISNITWTVYGKIQSITKSNETISFTYDAAGNRISKTVTPTSGTPVTTWYVRDAQGNIMSVYTSGDQTVNSGDLSRTEIDLYGSSRLGTIRDSVDVSRAPGYTRVALGLPDSANVLTFMRGYKLFELSNHLGNVLVTTSDKKYGVSLNDSLVDHFIPAVVSANDYYPFGSQMPGRDTTFGGNLYRYGFNGKENDNEVKGVGDQQDYGMRIYDPRVGRFLSIDPLTKKYPGLTPYQFASNGPIDGTDLDGKEWSPAGKNDGDPRDATAVRITVDPKLIDDARAMAAELERYRNEIITDTDIYGAKHRGPRVVVYKELLQAQANYEQGMQSNLQGVAGSAGYLIDGPRGASAGAVLDQVVFSYTPGGVPDENSSAFPSTPKNQEAMEIRTETTDDNALSFKIQPAKYKYFYGEVTTGKIHNILRSKQNLEDLTAMGLTDINVLNSVIMGAFTSGTVTSTKTNEYGVTVMKNIIIANKESLDVGFFYKDGNMKATPSVSTIIPKTAKKE